MTDLLVNAMRSASAGVYAQSKRVSLAAENLANAEATGHSSGSLPYTRKTISFDSVLDDAAGVDIVKIGEIGVDPSPYRTLRDPSHPASDAAGMVKLPNVNVLVEMSDIREASRSYEANIQVIRQSREMISLMIDAMRANT